MPKISIIVPIYNGEKYLRQCLNSLVNQTFKDIEIICINDCSTDSSLDILTEYSERDNRIKVINQKINHGQSVARNMGLDISNGEYVMFIDQDDWYEIDTCEKVYTQISANNNDFLIFNIKYHYENSGNTKIEQRRLIPFEKVINNPKIKPYEVGTNIFCSSFIWCQIYNKKFLIENEIKFYKEKQSDDVPFFVKAMVSAETISILPEPFYHYRIYDGQTTSSRTDLWEAVFRTRELAYQFVLSSNHAKDFINPFLVYYINSIIYWFDYNSKINNSIKYKYYKKMHNAFKILSKNHNIQAIAGDINYQYFCEIIKENSFLKMIKDKIKTFRKDLKL